MKGVNGKKRPKTSVTAEYLVKLYTEDLKDIYWAEKHLLRALPKMAKAADSEELRTAFGQHLIQTRDHVARVEKAFAASGIKVAAKKCEGMEGLVKEGEEVIEQFEAGKVRDAGLIIAAQKVEHYEIAAYGSLRSLARVMGFEKAAVLFQSNLEEESKTDKLLSKLSDTVNKEAFDQSEGEDEYVEMQKEEFVL